MTSVPNSIDLGTRSSTPKLPPGLNISHAHPSPSETKGTPTEQEVAKDAATTPGPITPAVPLLPIGQRDEISKQKAYEVDEEKHTAFLEIATGTPSEGKVEASIVETDISLGSPKPRRGQPNIEGKPQTVRQTELASSPVHVQERSSEPKSELRARGLKNYGPGNIIIPPARTESKPNTAQPETAKVQRVYRTAC